MAASSSSPDAVENFTPDAMDHQLPTPAIVVRAGNGREPIPYYEAMWHTRRPEGGWKPVKARVGKAWLVQDGVNEAGRPVWVKRRGRVAEGFFDERRAHAAAPALVERWAQRERSKTVEVPVAETVTVRELAHEWHTWLRDIRGASASTVADYGALLREPGAKTKRGRPSHGRLMTAFGDRTAITVTPREVSEWLSRLDNEGLQPRNVNKHRQLIHAVFVYGCRHDAYALPSNPVVGTDQRREPPPARLDYYEPAEVEALARAAAEGAHRTTPNYKGRPTKLSFAERKVRSAEDARDAELFRTKLYTGLRLGEILAVRVEDVTLEPDLEGGTIDLRHAISAGVDQPPKGWKLRQVPLARSAAHAIHRVLEREDFTGPDDYVFCTRIGGRMSPSAVRKRYMAARSKAGLRAVKLHGLRHSAGSIVAKSAGALVARDFLGHAHVSTTNRYLSGKTDRRLVAVLNDAFDAEQSADRT